MRKALAYALIANLALAIAGTPLCMAKLSNEQLQAAIRKDKILPEDSPITFTFNGSELLASTYKVENAREEDLKIDAVFVAKTAFQLDSTLSRTTVQFHEIRNPSVYYEVGVTVGDVAAYGSGKVSQDQLLSGLKLTRFDTSSPKATTKESSQPNNSAATDTEAKDTATSSQITASTGTDSNTSNAVAMTAPSNAKHATAAQTAQPNRATYSAYGVTISYPNQWKVDNPRSGGALIRLYFPLGNSISGQLEMRAYSAKDLPPSDLMDTDPRDTFEPNRDISWLDASSAFRSAVQQSLDLWHQEDAVMYRKFSNRGDLDGYRRWKTSFRNHFSTVRPVAVPQTINLGQTKSLHGAQRAAWMVEKDYYSEQYVRWVAFNCSGCTIMLSVFCPDKAYAGQCNAVFDDFLAHVRTSGANASTKPAKTK